MSNAELSRDNPEIIERFGSVYRKRVWLSDEVGDTSNLPYMRGQDFESSSLDGPWQPMSVWVWYY